MLTTFYLKLTTPKLLLWKRKRVCCGKKCQTNKYLYYQCFDWKYRFCQSI